MGTAAEHESAFQAMAARRELSGGDHYMVDAESGLVTRATVWVHGDVWFFSHYEKSHPRYRQEYEYAACRPSTFWQPRKQ